MSSDPISCPRCSECASSEHHWLDNPDFGADDSDPDYRDSDDRNPTGNSHVCKHCPAVGHECDLCDGTGEAIDDESGNGYACPKCNEEGVVVAEPRPYIE